MGDDREEIARLLADFNDYVRGEKINRVHIIRAAAVMSSRINAILARQGPGPGEAVALTSALANACYLMSEPHLSGHRVILGFDTLDGAAAAHVALSMAIIAATPTRDA